MTDQNYVFDCPIGYPFASSNMCPTPASLADHLPFREPTTTRFRVIVPAQRRQS